MSDNLKSLLAGSCLASFCVFSPTLSHAFDCSKASTKTEHAICNNPELLEMDENMAQHYFSLVRRLDKKPAEMTRNSQRNWLKYREAYCEGEAACLLDEDQNRLNALNSVIQQQPEMVPVFLWQEGTASTYTITIDAVKFAYPDDRGLKAFNSAIDNVISKAPFLTRSEDASAGALEFATAVQITQLTSDMVSALVSTYEYAGGAHPNGYSTAINIDLSNGEKLKTEDVFAFGAIERLTDDCRTAIIKTKADMHNQPEDEAAKELDDEYGPEIRNHITDMNTWHFNENGATITFNAYEIGPYAEGEFICEFSHEVLRELARQPELIRR